MPGPKILSPNKKVLLPDSKAGCSLSDSCPPHLFKKFKEKYPNHLVITYVNCTAELKALSDIVCTSSNAVQIVESLPKDQKIIFGPDKNLGAYVMKKTGRDMVLWNGACMVHEIFAQEKITKLKERHPQAKFIAHPECEDHILAMADNTCACNDCPHMKRNTLEKLYLCLKNELPEVDVPREIIERARLPIERMLDISAKLGL